MPVEPSSFGHALAYEFGGDPAVDSGKLWELIQESVRGYRTMLLIISDRPDQEAERLRWQSLRIDPQPVTGQLLRLAASVDGAVLIGPDGVCHAIGVKLDGIATEQEDTSRDASFTAARSYQESARRYLGRRSVAIVISEHGMADIISSLPSSVPAESIERNFNRLQEILDGHPEQNILEIHELLVWFDEHRAGLAEHHCQFLNRAMYLLPPDIHSYIYMPHYKTWKPDLRGKYRVE